MTEKTCESCGMPMCAPADFGGGNTSSRYCVHCTDAKGTLKPYEVKLAELARFVATRMNVGEETAVTIARENMAKLPAWKDQEPRP